MSRICVIYSSTLFTRLIYLSLTLLQICYAFSLIWLVFLPSCLTLWTHQHQALTLAAALSGRNDIIQRRISSGSSLITSTTCCSLFLHFFRPFIDLESDASFTLRGPLQWPFAPSRLMLSQKYSNHQIYMILASIYVIKRIPKRIK